MSESLLIKRQTGGLQPDLKRDFDADFFPVDVEKFAKGLVKPIQHSIQQNKNTVMYSGRFQDSFTQKKIIQK